MTSREQFEEIFRKAYPNIPQSHKDTMLEWYNHGTDDEPEWGYYSLLARQAFEWWELSRKAVEVESTTQHVAQEKSKPYAWAIEHKVGLPTVVFNKPNTNSWAFKDAVIKELYETPDLEKSDDKS
jgi:hypothetical protein